MDARLSCLLATLVGSQLLSAQCDVLELAAGAPGPKDTLGFSIAVQGGIAVLGAPGDTSTTDQVGFALVFALDDQGPDRLRVEQRFMFAPIAEAAASIGGAVQWPIDESLAALSCPIRAIAGDPGRLPVDALKAMRPDVEIEVVDGVGHYPHLFATERVRDLIEGWLD